MIPAPQKRGFFILKHLKSKYLQNDNTKNGQQNNSSLLLCDWWNLFGNPRGNFMVTLYQ